MISHAKLKKRTTKKTLVEFYYVFIDLILHNLILD